MPSYNLRKRSVSNEDIKLKPESKKFKNIADLDSTIPPTILESLKSLNILTSNNFVYYFVVAELGKIGGDKLFDSWLALSPSKKQSELDSVFVHAWFKYLDYKGKSPSGKKEIKDFLMQKEKKKTNLSKKTSPTSPTINSAASKISRPNSPSKKSFPIESSQLLEKKQQLKKPKLTARRKLASIDLHEAKKQLISIPSCENLKTIVSPKTLQNEKTHLKPTKIGKEPAPGLQKNVKSAGNQ